MNYTVYNKYIHLGKVLPDQLSNKLLNMIQKYKNQMIRLKV